MCKGTADGAEAGLDGKQCGMSSWVTPTVRSRTLTGLTTQGYCKDDQLSPVRYLTQEVMPQVAHTGHEASEKSSLC